MLNYRADNAMAKDTKMIQKHDFSLQKTKRLTLRHVPHCSLRLHTNKIASMGRNSYKFKQLLKLKGGYVNYTEI